ncbi:MAG TPA: UbiD family decarboxylase [Terriglobia bacterium]|jgi:4-hydroxy-3-polyprenylbenzoate decarboxylase|nr:UbiD family decarboxylase [Terriglobia bacterium]
MAYRNLGEFISRLDREGELRRIAEPVDVDLEITEITDRVSKAGGPALLFERPRSARDGRDYSVPLLINTLGSSRRLELALDAGSIEEVAGRIDDLLDMKPPGGLFDKMRMLPKLAELGSIFPKTVSSGPAQEVIETEGLSLAQFPIMKCWPQDGGRFITWPMVITRSPKTGRRNVGCYRMQVFDERTTAMHWQIHKGGAEHFRALARSVAPVSAPAIPGATVTSAGGDTDTTPRRRLDVAVAIGADPITMLSGILPLPEDLDEFLFAGFLRRQAVELVKCRTVDLEVPAEAEIVLEGYVDLDDMRSEGPFGDHTGYYTLPDVFPAFHLTAITHRRDPIYVSTIVGPPPMEDYWMGHAVERLFLPLMRRQMPEVVDMHMPPEGVFHNLMIVSIRKRYPGHARKVMHAIWGLPGAMFTKCIVVVDDDVDVHNLREVAWKAFNHIDPERDIQFTLGPVDQLEHASRLPNFGSKMGIDATHKWPGEGFMRPWPDEIKMDEATKKRVDHLWRSLGL